MCIRSLGWKEEFNADIQRRCDELWGDTRQPRCLLWIDKMDRRGRVYSLGTDLALAVSSRLEGMKDVANKSDTERCITLCRDLGLSAFTGARSYFPRTWLLPDQRAEFEAHVRERRLEALSKGQPVPTYIVKPSGGSEGAGIFLLQHETKVPRYHVKTVPLVAQTYIPPLLLDGKKFDLRLYVLIRSVDPLEVYVHTEGLARFCTEDYEEPTEENLKRAFAHLTNYSLNKKSGGFVHMTHADIEAAKFWSRVENGEEEEEESDNDDDDDEQQQLGRQKPSKENAPSNGDGAAAAAATAPAAATAADFDYAGCSKRPVRQVLKELEERGLVREGILWNHIDRLVALTAIAIQPELALRYRARFPRYRDFENAKQAAAAAGASSSNNNTTTNGTNPPPPDAGRSDRSRQAFHVVGLDVLIDERGWPYLLEINSKPSQALDATTEDGRVERSPIDVEVKKRVMTDFLHFVAGGERSALLRPVTGIDARRKPPPMTTELLDRTRRIFDVLTRKPTESTINQVPDEVVTREISGSKFTTFARSAGLNEIVKMPEVQLCYANMVRKQEDPKEVRTKSYQIVDSSTANRNGGMVTGNGGPLVSARVSTPAESLRPRDQQRIERMRFPAFARALSEMADRAFEQHVLLPLPPGWSVKAARLEMLLEHIASYTAPPEPKASPRPLSASPSPRITFSSTGAQITGSPDPNDLLITIPKGNPSPQRPASAAPTASSPMESSESLQQVGREVAAVLGQMNQANVPLPDVMRQANVSIRQQDIPVLRALMRARRRALIVPQHVQQQQMSMHAALPAQARPRPRTRSSELIGSRSSSNRQSQLDTRMYYDPQPSRMLDTHQQPIHTAAAPEQAGRGETPFLDAMRSSADPRVAVEQAARVRTPDPYHEHPRTVAHRSTFDHRPQSQHAHARERYSQAEMEHRQAVERYKQAGDKYEQAAAARYYEQQTGAQAPAAGPSWPVYSAGYRPRSEKDRLQSRIARETAKARAAADRYSYHGPRYC